MSAAARELAERDAFDKLYRTLRNVRPTKVVAVLDADSGLERAIAMPKGRKKWEIVANAVCSMIDDVERVELRNDDDEVLRVWNPPELPQVMAGPGADVDRIADGELGPPLPTDTPKTLVWAEAFALRMIAATQAAADAAIKRHMAGMETVLTKTVDVLTMTAQLNRELLAQQNVMLRSTYTATVARARAEAIGKGGEGGTEGMGEAEAMFATLARQMMGLPDPMAEALKEQARAAAAAKAAAARDVDDVDDDAVTGDVVGEPKRRAKPGANGRGRRHEDA